MDKYYKALQKHKSRLVGLPNVCGVGVGFKRRDMKRTGNPALIVFVEKKEKWEDLSRGERVPKKIGGLETDVIEIGKVRLLGTRQERHRPAKPGVSIGHYKISAGTFGALVKDVETGERLILSNNHILANGTNGRDGRAEIGDPILQPGPYDGGTSRDRIARLERFIPLERIVQEPECQMAAGAQNIGNRIIKMVRPNYEMKLVKHTRASNIIDAAVAKPDSPDLVAGEVMELGAVEGVGEPQVGMLVQKSGRSSGLTEGEITAMSVSLRVELDEEEYGWFSHQIVSDCVVNPGDSGSLVLNKESKAVGLVFAGSDQYSVFNVIDNVLKQLKVTF
jgi:hypothetical protein